MDRKKTKTDFHRKSRSTSRVSARSIYAKKTVEEEPVPPNTQVFTPKHMPKLTSTVLPFGKPSLKKASTTRQRRRHHSTIPPVRRSLLEKRDSDSSSSHSVQDQQSKLKINSTHAQKQQIFSWNSTLEGLLVPITEQKSSRRAKFLRNTKFYIVKKSPRGRDLSPRICVAAAERRIFVIGKS
ncbi:hypothetical protein Y032_0023g660 [Ancylostoma ceylanicum]|uniref:Uncharacterized protein n=1 Tax=Ancylostoma ceylanicum TaxID=53326 RepID=A0A016UWW3_9BILA|nr:hypothetical protein Y032_0023g660 [Ancylostoma ceylanicum]